MGREKGSLRKRKKQKKSERAHPIHIVSFISQYCSFKQNHVNTPLAYQGRESPSYTMHLSTRRRPRLHK